MTTSAARISIRRTRWVTVVDEGDLHSLLRDIPNMAGSLRDDSERVLEELQHAVEEHERILARQAELIRRLRQELKDVGK